MSENLERFSPAFRLALTLVERMPADYAYQGKSADRLVSKPYRRRAKVQQNGAAQF